MPLAVAGCLVIGAILPPPARAAVAGESFRQAHRLLRALDRFLDHHPLLEDDLRLDPKLVTNPGFGAKNPDLQDFLAANPGVIQALQMEPRHFLHRALIREANAPLRYAEVAQLDPLLAAQPAIERRLVGNPALIRDRNYLSLHPALGMFLAHHPLLANVFHPDPGGPDGAISPASRRSRMRPAEVRVSHEPVHIPTSGPRLASHLPPPAGP